jgi:hypothetical protein
MKLNAPKKITWWISLILAIIAIIARWILKIDFLTDNCFIILLIGYIIIWLGTFVKGF